MADLFFTISPDIETLLINDMRTWFSETVKWDTLFPTDPIKFSADHPFVSLLQQNIPEDGTYDLTGFPCVTVVDTNCTKGIDTATLPIVYQLNSSIITEIETYKRDRFIMSKETFEALKTAFLELGVTENIYAEGYQKFMRSEVAIEIWAANSVLKGKLFDLINLYLSGQNRFTLKSNSDIIIEEETISGEKSGTYNMDFGALLYGAMIHFNVNYPMGAFTVKDFTICAGVTVIDNAII